jgi:hypothetical protein
MKHSAPSYIHTGQPALADRLAEYPLHPAGGAGLALDVKSHFDTALYIPLVILHTKYTRALQNDFNVYA